MLSRRTIIAGLALATLLGGCARKAEKAAPAATQRQPVEVAPLTRQDLEEILNVVGSVAANESATIRPESTGLVRSIHFEEGQRVKNGDLLVKIDDSELRAQFTQNEARYRLAELNLQRAEQLGESQSNSVADIDRARSEYASAKSDLDLIKVRLDRTEIRAPFDGVVGARTLSPGDYVNSQSVITSINDLSRLKIDFQVPERYVAKVHPGTQFKLRSQAMATADGLTGQVYFVAAVVDRATRSSEVKGFIAGASAGLQPGMFANVEHAGLKSGGCTGGLQPGMFANVELVLDVRRNVLTVPEGSILTTTNGTQILAVKDEGNEKTVEVISVRTGLRAKGQVEVMPLNVELTETRQIIASGVGALVLYPGTLIEPRPFVNRFESTAEL